MIKRFALHVLCCPKLLVSELPDTFAHQTSSPTGFNHSKDINIKIILLFAARFSVQNYAKNPTWAIVGIKITTNRDSRVRQ